MKFDKLSNLCTIQIGKTPSRQVEHYWGNGSPWVAISDLKNKYICKTKEQITQIAIDETNCKEIPKGTLLMSFKLSIGKLAFSKCNLFINEAIAGIILKNKEVLNKNYLYYALKNIPLLKDAKIAVKGNTLNKKSLGNLQIPLPESLDEQIKIANLLSRIEILIVKREESIKLLDKLLHSTFLDMFGDIRINNKNWEISKLNTLCKLISGGTPPRKNLEYFNGDIPWITTVSLGKYYIDNNDAVEWITKDAILNSSTKLIPINSIIIGTRVGVGKVSINSVELCTNQDIVSLVNIQNNINEIYLADCIRYYKSTFIRQARGATIQGISMKVLKNIDIPLPPRPLQDKFATIVQQVKKTKDKYKDSLKKLNKLFGSLSQKAFQGKLDLSKIELITNKLEDKPLENKVYEPKLTNVETVSIKSTPIKNLETYIFDLIKQNDFSIEKIQHNFNYDEVKNKIFEMLEDGRIKQKFKEEYKEKKYSYKTELVVN